MINNGGEVRTRFVGHRRNGYSSESGRDRGGRAGRRGRHRKYVFNYCSLQLALTLLDNVYSWIFLENKRTYLTSNRYISY